MWISKYRINEPYTILNELYTTGSAGRTQSRSSMNLVNIFVRLLATGSGSWSRRVHGKLNNRGIQMEYLQANWSKHLHRYVCKWYYRSKAIEGFEPACFGNPRWTNSRCRTSSSNWSVRANWQEHGRPLNTIQKCNVPCIIWWIGWIKFSTLLRELFLPVHFKGVTLQTSNVKIVAIKTFILEQLLTTNSHV